MKLPPYSGPEPYSKLQKCQDELRRDVRLLVDKMLTSHSSVRELEAMCSALDGVRDLLAGMALELKRKEQGDSQSILMMPSKNHFKNGSFTYRYIPYHDSIQQGNKRKKTNGKR